MTTAKEIFDYLCEIAPLDYQEEWDNSGFLLGDKCSVVHKVLLALDATSDVINEAGENNYDLIITHHPLIFGSINNVINEDITGNKILTLGKFGINVISMHTNLDKTLVNKELIKHLADKNFIQANDFMWTGELETEKTIGEYISGIIDELNSKGVRYYDSGRKVNKIGCVGGAGDEFLFDAVRFGCDTFVTADIKHHMFLNAKELGLNLIDANHFSTENLVMFKLKQLLDERFTDIKFDIAKNNVLVIDYAKK